MKYNQEIIDWFNNYFYNCYYVKHEDYPESIFMFYDINYVRQLKLAKLEGKETPIKIDITGECLFELEWKNKWFGCNYNLIMNYLEVKYSFNYDDFQSFITDRLEEHTKMNVLTPIMPDLHNSKRLEEHTKMNILTPCDDRHRYVGVLEEHTKMNILTPTKMCILTPKIRINEADKRLEEHIKMSVLTPLEGMVTELSSLEEHTKMNVLTPSPIPITVKNVLEEYAKMNVLT